jgi:hypothetical protein
MKKEGIFSMTKYVLNYCYKNWTELGNEEYDTIEEAQAVANQDFDDDTELKAVEIYECNLVNTMKRASRKKV